MRRHNSLALLAHEGRSRTIVDLARMVEDNDDELLKRLERLTFIEVVSDKKVVRLCQSPFAGMSRLSLKDYIARLMMS